MAEPTFPSTDTAPAPSTGPSQSAAEGLFGGAGQTAGGSGSSSSSSGGSSASAAAAEAKAEKERAQKAKEAFRGLLHRYRIPVGPFGRLIEHAAKDEWNQDEFLFDMSRSKEFRQMFQGIGTLFKEGLSLTSAITEWRQRAAAYKDVHSTLDIPMKLNRRKVGLLIKNNVSPDEYASRLLMEEQMEQQESLRLAFNQVRAQMGQQPWDQNRWKKLVTAKDRTLKDQYEAARLFSSGLNLGVQEAIDLAKSLGTPAELFEGIGDLVAKVKQVRQFAGQELDQAGITDADLLALESGADPKGKAKDIERIIKAREALGTQTGGATRERTATGVPDRFASPIAGL